jgi:hypothetical protein
MFQENPIDLQAMKRREENTNRSAIIIYYCNMYEKLEFLRNLDCELRLANQVANESCDSICHFCFVYKKLLNLKLLKWHLLRINY